MLATVSMLAVAAVTLGSGTASAAVPFYNKCKHLSVSNEWENVIYNQNDRYVGMALFSSNGDNLYAVDSYADGWGVVASLRGVRSVSTVGHNSPYTAGPVIGNLPEDKRYVLDVEMRNGSSGWIALGCEAYS
ncbi:hypothetical protein [Streptomyces phaeochromogenes]|uniref:hypothetical protein n=1 Tax=Streptomyces phaeochromogenes TaxID=1923 RepID=UPI003404A675